VKKVNKIGHFLTGWCAPARTAGGLGLCGPDSRSALFIRVLPGSAGLALIRRSRGWNVYNRKTRQNPAEVNKIGHFFTLALTAQNLIMQRCLALGGVHI
jgi:hypothetical protein